MSVTAAPLMLQGLRPEDLVEALEARGVAISLRQARRVQAHVLSQGAPGWPDGLPRTLLQALEVHAARGALTVRERFEDPHDHSVRYLLQSPDGAVHEAVRIPLEKPGAFSVCLSSQVGCAMGCAFCATGRLGLGRHLAAWEMVAAWMLVQAEAPGRVTGAVFMGQGEPLHNYDAVIRAAQVLSHPNGGRISGKAISISTVGLVPQIRRYTAEGHKFRLVVSMTSAVDERRRGLLPVAGKWTLDELAQAIAEHHAATGRRVTVAWVLMGGVNHDHAEVEALQGLLGQVPIRLNLIDVNDGREGPEAFRRATDAERNAFMDALQVLRVPVVRRYSVGRDRRSACGMLAAGASVG